MVLVSSSLAITQRGGEAVGPVGRRAAVPAKPRHPARQQVATSAASSATSAVFSSSTKHMMTSARPVAMPSPSTPGGLQPSHQTARSVRCFTAKKIYDNSDDTLKVNGSDHLEEEINGSERQSEDAEQFEWTKHWYPCHVIDGMDTSRPIKFTLLGIELVFWKDGGGRWRAFQDKCPHRLAPLSEGRIESDGTLLCAYHGWRFDGKGTCTALPQASSPELLSKVCRNKASCVVSYPTREDQGLLWVWPEPGPEGLLSSRGKDPLVPPEMQPDYSEGEATVFAWSLRDLPYGWDAFFENVTDSAHVPVSHHNIVGNRYTDPKPIPMPVKRSLTPTGGFHIGGHDWKPPYFMRIHISDTLKLTLFNVPTTPGRSRHIGNNIIIKPRDPKDPFVQTDKLSVFSNPMPKWLMHVLASLFLHQDLVFLHHQERILKREPRRWLDSCFMPTESDGATITFRRWLERHGELDVYGKASVPWASVGGVGSELEGRAAGAREQELFDVYHSHVQHCTHCQGALRNIKVLRLIIATAAVTLAIRAIYLSLLHSLIQASSPSVVPTVASSGVTSQVAAYLTSVIPTDAWLAAGLAVVCAITALGASKLIGLFYEYRFNHQDNK
mmetsp:Transcript_17266/g.20757  ORF Transcript_17266/g.20757 Transcript_17266/m.20757 type:complete len:612 (-) Transcript_17266:296-2131(-)|eukprot:CAMPEP_0197845014 /NCGR_PEP_ID=MMETSP1438-20131217/1969_1 /TAXON_ID=1461541 /ORGANISM="Pterosperma sp., Strain CCMP1384" /LENGTH=611 /DNA_ID=CAMNT_0043456079 /DNA_START=226 /DNA_END=2061 /DNA_ORIENTATION=+